MPDKTIAGIHVFRFAVCSLKQIMEVRMNPQLNLGTRVLFHTFSFALLTCAAADTALTEVRVKKDFISIPQATNSQFAAASPNTRYFIIHADTRDRGYTETSTFGYDRVQKRTFRFPAFVTTVDNRGFFYSTDRGPGTCDPVGVSAYRLDGSRTVILPPTERISATIRAFDSGVGIFTRQTELQPDGKAGATPQCSPIATGKSSLYRSVNGEKALLLFTNNKGTDLDPRLFSVFSDGALAVGTLNPDPDRGSRLTYVVSKRSAKEFETPFTWLAPYNQFHAIVGINSKVQLTRMVLRNQRIKIFPVTVASVDSLRVARNRIAGILVPQIPRVNTWDVPNNLFLVENDGSIRDLTCETPQSVLNGATVIPVPFGLTASEVFINAPAPSVVGTRAISKNSYCTGLVFDGAGAERYFPRDFGIQTGLLPIGVENSDGLPAAEFEKPATLVIQALDHHGKPRAGVPLTIIAGTTTEQRTTPITGTVTFDIPAGHLCSPGREVRINIADETSQSLHFSSFFFESRSPCR